jgi:hypothetical protein
MTAPTTSAGPAPVSARPGLPRGASRRLSPLQIGSLAGLALAVVATVLPWLSFSVEGLSADFNAWSEASDALGLSDMLGLVGTDDPDGSGIPLDALAVLALAGLGAYLIGGPAIGLSVPSIPFTAVGVGGALLALGVLNLIYIEDQLVAGSGGSTGIGVYVLIIAGLVTAGCGYFAAKQTPA